MITLAPATMPRIANVDERYQSYNVEMLEVTGGKFWKPYAAKSAAMPKPNATGNAAVAGVTPAGMNPDMYEYRPPIDLTNARWIKLAAALAPAYVRVSGTWANTSYFPESDDAPSSPPAGFDGVLTRQQWKGVVDFAHAVKAGIVTSFRISPGTRDANGACSGPPVSGLHGSRGLICDLGVLDFENVPDRYRIAVLPGRGQGVRRSSAGSPRSAERGREMFRRGATTVPGGRPAPNAAAARQGRALRR